MGWYVQFSRRLSTHLGAKPPAESDELDLSPVIHSPGPVTWRSDFLIEYWGEHGNAGVNQCYEDIGDCWNNTFVGLRTLSETEDFTYVEFPLENNFQEFYDMKIDTFQLKNAVNDMQPAFKERVQNRLTQLKQCSGSSCSN